MLIEKVTDGWVRFMVLFATMRGEEAVELAKEAFLCVIETRNAVNYKKLKMLEDIVELCPDVLAQISDDEIRERFDRLTKEMIRRGEYVTHSDWPWIKKFVKDDQQRNQMEKVIYRFHLSGSSDWDKERRKIAWTLSDDERHEIIRDLLKNPRLGSKRKMELAKEFGEPHEDYQRHYYFTLLYQRHYDKADELGMKDDETVKNVILANIEAGYCSDALLIAQRYLADQPELAEEIHSIAKACDAWMPS